MDPNANLKEQLELARALLNDPELDGEDLALTAERLADLVESLAGWLETGGALPESWQTPECCYSHPADGYCCSSR